MKLITYILALMTMLTILVVMGCAPKKAAVKAPEPDPIVKEIPVLSTPLDYAKTSDVAAGHNATILQLRKDFAKGMNEVLDILIKQNEKHQKKIQDMIDDCICPNHMK